MRRVFYAALSLALVAVNSPAQAAYVLTTLSPYGQSFDFLSAAGSPIWTDDQPFVSPAGSPGWYWNTLATPALYFGDDGTVGGPPARYSYGSALAPDRAMGGLTAAFGGSEVASGIVFVNGSGVGISGITVTYTGEEWHEGLDPADKLTFSLLSSVAPIPGVFPPALPVIPGWTADGTLDFVPPVLGLIGALDGNAAANKTTLTDTIPVIVPPGSFLALRWQHGLTALPGEGLAIDDLAVSFIPVPEARAFWFGALAISMAGLVFCGRRWVNRCRAITMVADGPTEAAIPA